MSSIHRVKRRSWRRAGLKLSITASSRVEEEDVCCIFSPLYFQVAFPILHKHLVCGQLPGRVSGNNSIDPEWSSRGSETLSVPNQLKNCSPWMTQLLVLVFDTLAPLPFGKHSLFSCWNAVYLWRSLSAELLVYLTKAWLLQSGFRVPELPDTTSPSSAF